MKQSFIFHTRWADGLSGQPDEIRLEVYDAVIRYATTGGLLKLRPIARALFRMIKLEIDEDMRREADMEAVRLEYQDRQRASGMKGAAARWGQCAPEVPGMGFIGSDGVGWGTLKSPSQPIQSPILPQNGADGGTDIETETKENDKEERSKEEIDKEKKEKDLPIEKITPSEDTFCDKKELAPPPPPRGSGAAPSAPRPKFIPPTAGEVEDYAASKGLSLDASRFCDFYESKGWKVGSSPMKDWRAAVRNWARRDTGRANPDRRGADDYSDSEVWGR